MRNERIQPVDEVQLLRAAACDWRLSRGDVGVFAVILQHCDADRVAYPGPTRIGELARLSPTNVKASIRRLEVFEYIAVTRPGERRKNTFTVLESPDVPSRKRQRQIQKTRTELGMRAGPVSGKALAATGYAGMQPTGYAGMRKLGLSARQEVAFKALLKSQPAALASEDQEQEQSPGAKPVATSRELEP